MRDTQDVDLENASQGIIYMLSNCSLQHSGSLHTYASFIIIVNDKTIISFPLTTTLHAEEERISLLF